MSRPRIPARAVRLIPLLGSSIDGEALSACRALERTLAAVGLDLNDLAAVIPTVPEASSSTRAAPSFFDMARACRDLNDGRLEDRERIFVASMVRLGSSPPSPRQAQWLGDIFARLHRRAAA